MSSYLTVDGESRFVLEIKKSEFITTVAAVKDADDADEFVRRIKSEYPDATHNCYAYIADEAGMQARFSDDGEPSGTAGQPMLEVLRKRGLRKVAAVVTRYFGGIKLGAGGLVGAYTASVAQTLDNMRLITMTECDGARITLGYSEFASVGRIAQRHKAKVVDVRYGDSVSFALWMPRGAKGALADIRELTSGNAVIEDIGTGYIDISVAE